MLSRKWCRHDRDECLLRSAPSTCQDVNKRTLSRGQSAWRSPIRSWLWERWTRSTP
jgi:hypothetical protein